MPYLLRRSSPRAEHVPEITGRLGSADILADEALPNREHFASILTFLDPRAERRWAHQSSPEEFWSLLFARGAIHHPLYSQARSILSAPPATSQASERQGSQIALTEIIVSLSKSAKGRELVLGFFQSLPSLECYRISNVVAPFEAPAEGAYPLQAPHQLSDRAIQSFSATASLPLLSRWWNRVLELSTLDRQPFRPKRFPQPAPKLEHEMRLLSLNVWGVPAFSGWKSWRFPRIAQMLHDKRYDGVALQEMWDPSSRVILAKSSMPHFATCARFPGLAARSGLVTLSRHPLTDIQELTFTRRGGVECAVAKGALATRLKMPSGRTVLFANTHLQSPPERGSGFLCSEERADAIRVEQILELGEWLRTLRNPGEAMIVMGDFNCPEDSPHYHLLQEQFGLDLFRERLPLVSRLESPSEYEGRVGLTFDPKTNHWAKRTPSARLDYCFGSFPRPDLIDLTARRTCVKPHEIISDHFGIELSIRSYHEGEKEC